jgi:PleD family two-component response regulator
MGVATSSGATAQVKDVIKAADEALYGAKEAGRNRIETANAARRRARTKSAGIA